jgi:hypothetical protein
MWYRARMQTVTRGIEDDRIRTTSLLRKIRGKVLYFRIHEFDIDYIVPTRVFLPITAR